MPAAHSSLHPHSSVGSTRFALLLLRSSISLFMAPVMLRLWKSLQWLKALGPQAAFPGRFLAIPREGSRSAFPVPPPRSLPLSWVPAPPASVHLLVVKMDYGAHQGTFNSARRLVLLQRGVVPELLEKSFLSLCHPSPEVPTFLGWLGPLPGSAAAVSSQLLW